MQDFSEMVSSRFNFFGIYFSHAWPVGVQVVVNYGVFEKIRFISFFDELLLFEGSQSGLLGDFYFSFGHAWWRYDAVMVIAPKVKVIDERLIFFFFLKKLK